jgi:predicted ester cyclase
MATKTESAPAGTADVVRGYFDALARQDLEAAGDHWAPGGMDRLHGLADLRAPDDVRDYFATLFAAFPDFRFEVISMAAEGELAAVRWRLRATFAGPGRFQGFAPNGATVDLEGCDMLTVRDGLIQENHAYTNAADLARQLGALPPAGSAQERALTAMVNARTRIAGLLRR